MTFLREAETTIRLGIVLFWRGEGNGNPLQPGESHGQRKLGGYDP